ncbi:hypothetical protein [Desulfovibrio sp. MES5]|uniref:hypothetical protein n=1 Tax=Desulfovibrio sp. MES5 TaxID=1899016 RepID=UPI0025BF8B4A|nr:hypothetical protein [Desulfovibrio sp. MES5]
MPPCGPGLAGLARWTGGLDWSAGLGRERFTAGLTLHNQYTATQRCEPEARA